MELPVTVGPVLLPDDPVDDFHRRSWDRTPAQNLGAYRDSLVLFKEAHELGGEVVPSVVFAVDAEKTG